MKNRSMCWLCMVVAMPIAVISNAADFTVGAGSPKVMSAAESAIYYRTVSVNDDLTLDGMNCGLTNSSTITIGEYATVPVTIAITNGAKWVVYASNSLRFKGRGGTFVLSSPTEPSYTSWATANLPIGNNIYVAGLATAGYYSQVEVMGDVVADNGVMDIARLLDKGTASFRWIHNRSGDVAARVLFEGGLIWVHNDTSTESDRYRFKVSNNARIILESLGGHPIYLRSGAQNYGLFKGAGTLETKGAGDFIMHHGHASLRTITLSKDYNGEIVWGHSGRTCFRGIGTWKIGTDNILPYGMQTGPVVFSNPDSVGSSAQTILDLNGKTVTVNGLLREGTYGDKNIVTNSVAAMAALRLNVETNAVLSGLVTATFAANASSNITMQKNGSGALVADTVPSVAGWGVLDGALTLSNLWQTGFLTVHGGTARIANESGWILDSERSWRPRKSQIANVSVENGALDIERGCLSSTNVSIAAGASIRLCGGAGITNRVDFYTVGLTDRYYRFIFKESANRKSFALNQLFLQSHNGAREFGVQGSETPKYALNETASSASDLAAGQYMYSSPAGIVFVEETRSNGNCVYSKDGLSARAGWGGVIINENKGLSLSNPNTWVTLTVRLRDEAVTPLIGYVLANDWTVDDLNVWEVQASPDGSTWRTVDERTRSDIYTFSHASSPDNTQEGYGTYNNGEPFAWRCLADSNAFRCEGDLQVDEGAVLDLSCVPAENIRIEKIVFNVPSGGGTIKKFRPAVNGTLNITGLSGNLRRHYKTSVSVLDVIDVENLSSWRVTINGIVSQGTRLYIADGFLCTHTPQGLTISFR